MLIGDVDGFWERKQSTWLSIGYIIKYIINVAKLTINTISYSTVLFSLMYVLIHFLKYVYLRNFEDDMSRQIRK